MIRFYWYKISINVAWSPWRLFQRFVPILYYHITLSYARQFYDLVCRGLFYFKSLFFGSIILYHLFRICKHFFIKNFKKIGKIWGFWGYLYFNIRGFLIVAGDVWCKAPFSNRSLAFPRTPPWYWVTGSISQHANQRTKQHRPDTRNPQEHATRTHVLLTTTTLFYFCQVKTLTTPKKPKCVEIVETKLVLTSRA